MQKRKKNFLPRGMIKKTLLAMTFKIPLNRDFQPLDRNRSVFRTQSNIYDEAFFFENS